MKRQRLPSTCHVGTFARSGACIRLMSTYRVNLSGSSHIPAFSGVEQATVHWYMPGPRSRSCCIPSERSTSPSDWDRPLERGAACKWPLRSFPTTRDNHCRLQTIISRTTYLRLHEQGGLIGCDPLAVVDETTWP